jgi:hypothetical protein
MKRTLRLGKKMTKSLTKVTLRASLLGACVLATGACNSFDTKREASPKGTLGDDLYGVMCDRVGASSLPEDIAGDSYRSVCHYDASGKYGDKVDEKLLPPPGKGDAADRKLALAKLDAMVSHRSDLVRAFNAAFPDIKIADTQHKGEKIRLHDALMDFSQRLAPLYDENPYIKNTDPLIPATTRALGRLFDKLGGHDKPEKGVDPAEAVLKAMQSMTARKGYRPFNVALGAIRPALAYPELRALTNASLKVLGPTGVASPELQQLLAAAKEEMLTSRPLVSKLPTLILDKDLDQPSRPRTNLEVLRKVMLTQSNAFAASASDPSRYIAARDSRGFVVPVGNAPGVPGTVPSPFVDMDGDGYADVDAFGRFVDANSTPLKLQTPFAIPGVVGTGAVDAFGRPTTAVYEYIDTSRTTLAAIGRHLVPLLDSTKLAQGADAWEQEHETLMYAMAGSYLLYGAREEAQYDYAGEMAGEANPIKTSDASCPGCFKYNRFKGEDSPIADLAHAAGQVLADKDSDALLLGVIDLVQNHEQEVTRLVGALLKIRAIAAQHDAMANNGEEPFASLDYKVPIWDEMATILVRIVQRPGLTAQLLGALADPAIVTPKDGARHNGDTMASFFKHKDFFTYDSTNLNGPAVNFTVGGSSTVDPQTNVDRKSPLTGDNRSIMQRSFQVIHDANRAVLCNKQGAEVATSFGVDWPIIGSDYDECELFRMDNAATFYLDTLLPLTHPKHGQMPLNPSTGLSTLLDLGDYLGLNVPTILQGSSGINGLTVDCQFASAPAGCATPQAINRLLYFGAATEVYTMPDLDTNGANSQTNKFVSKMLNAASTIVCPVDNAGQNICADTSGLYRTRDFGTMFAWERLGYYYYLQPIVRVFADQGCTPDESSCDVTNIEGEQIFVDLIDTFWRNWPGTEHGSECNNHATAATNELYCSEAGVNKYEPILADAMVTDLIPALNDFAVAATQLSSITVARGPNKGQTMTGAEVLEKVTRILFDPEYAAEVHMVDRHGKKSTTWTDGTPQKQLTVFTLFGDALHAIDERFDNACSCVGLSGSALSKCQNDTNACNTDATMRQGQWKRARSQLVDEFFAVDGDGKAAKFHNPATTKALVTIVETLREQLNANCPNREMNGSCSWAKTELGKKVADVLSGPLFAGIMDVQEQVRKDESARREFEKMLSFILVSASEDDAFQSSLASFDDLLQILSDDGRFSAIFNAAATASDPQADKGGPGCATTAINALEALAGDEYDRYHVLDTIMPALVTPIDGGTGPSPIEIMMDTISDVNRLDAQSEKPLATEDYRAVWRTMNEFMTDKTRGLEQFYHIIQNRPSE